VARSSGDRPLGAAISYQATVRNTFGYLKRVSISQTRTILTKLWQRLIYVELRGEHNYFCTLRPGQSWGRGITSGKHGEEHHSTQGFKQKEGMGWVYRAT
jgi:hypothetical protein